MKSYQNILSILSFSLVTGCVMPQERMFKIPSGKPHTPPNLELTLIHKEIPRRNMDCFSRAELSFSTNKTQQTHALLTRPLNDEIFNKIHSIPLGTTMKESEWDKVLLNKKKSPNGQIWQVGNWQRFY